MKTMQIFLITFVSLLLIKVLFWTITLDNEDPQTLEVRAQNAVVLQVKTLLTEDNEVIKCDHGEEAGVRVVVLYDTNSTRDRTDDTILSVCRKANT